MTTRLIVGLALALAALAAPAAPIIAVDLSLAPGIQSAVTARPGEFLLIDVRVANDGLAPSPVVFDSILLDAFHSDSTPGVSAFLPSPIAGNLTLATPLVVDAFAGLAAIPGAPLATGAAPPPAGAGGNLGGVGLIDLFPAPVDFILAPGASAVVFSLFVAVQGPGSSVIDTAGLFGQPALALNGAGIAATHLAATVTVVAEPAAGLLLMAGAGLIALGRRR